ncbi:SDR family NAD(P)-dependent oxidoreductase [Hyphomonas sp.]|uniref:SDR family NAD(P)-dependent oxidoreductase n=1 Tax=Hyphomonas sp. TaxID=87 RepID=UPI003527482B
MTQSLEGKAALVTGATSGIGAATARLFCERGAHVMLAGRNAEQGEQLARELGDRASFTRTDVTSEQDIESAIAATVEQFGSLDVLFSNAGAPTPGGVDTFTAEQFESAVNLLLRSVLFGIKHAAPIMKRQGSGSIINNSSVAAHRSHMGGYLYSVAKAAVSHATRMAGIELAAHGIRVNAISPGGIATPIFYGGSGAATNLTDAHREAKNAKLLSNLAKATPLRRAGLPENIAEAAAFLASDAASFVNCHDLVVDAGMIAGGRTNFE